MTTIKENFHKTMTLAEAQKLVLTALKQVMEEKISSENVEVCLIRNSTQKVELISSEEITRMLATLA
jgi:20S proteasome alpha/beta subunit